MTDKINHLGKSGRIEANARPAQSAKSAKSTSGKAAEKPNVFQFLMNELKARENNRHAGSLRNRPATSELVRQDHHRTSKNPRPTQGLNAQNVNNLAASALIALTAVSSGPNRIGGIYPQGVRGAGLSGGISNAGDVCSSMQGLGTKLCQGQQIGALSAHFESGEKGPGAVGYDPNGGTSYGTYQISSRAGTMKLFTDYLSAQAPDLAAKLKASGAANTGSTSGKMPEVWKKITAADPVRFSKLQYDFIEKSHYLPAVQEISERTGLDISKAPRALQEVLWSTAVQHGPNGAAKIFTKAIGRSQAKNDGIKMGQLIGSVYDLRAGQFGSSGQEVRSAVRGRFSEEGRLALAMLSDPFLNSEGVKV
jgi:hypothetical protein